MVQRLSNWLAAASPGWAALLATLVFFAFIALVLPAQAAKAEVYAGSAGIPDTTLFYGREDLYRMAEAYGEQGRQLYIRARYTFDLIFPLVYTIFLVTTISWVSTRGTVENSHWRGANLIPLLAMAFDLLENLSTSIIMSRYPLRTTWLDTLAPGFSLLKWVFVYASFVLLIVALLLWVRGRIGLTGKLTTKAVVEGEAAMTAARTGLVDRPDNPIGNSIPVDPGGTFHMSVKDRMQTLVQIEFDNLQNLIEFQYNYIDDLDSLVEDYLRQRSLLDDDLLRSELNQRIGGDFVGLYFYGFLHMWRGLVIHRLEELCAMINPEGWSGYLSTGAAPGFSRAIGFLQEHQGYEVPHELRDGLSRAERLIADLSTYRELASELDDCDTLVELGRSLFARVYADLLINQADARSSS